MSIEAMKQTLDFLEWFAGDDHSIRPKHKAPEIAAALRQAIEQAEKQEPVAWIVDGEIKVRLDMAGKLYFSETNVYTSPQKREWVGLTDEDIDLYAFDIGVTDNKAPAWLVTYARGIEAKLKEKNT
jgi:2-oxo-4-hydroxy-4-carboxy--5-ureidoimidazoline (OHCU) decarboxylase